MVRAISAVLTVLCAGQAAAMRAEAEAEAEEGGPYDPPWAKLVSGDIVPAFETVEGTCLCCIYHPSDSFAGSPKPAYHSDTPPRSGSEVPATDNAYRARAPHCEKFKNGNQLFREIGDTKDKWLAITSCYTARSAQGLCPKCEYVAKKIAKGEAQEKLCKHTYPAY